MVWQGLVDETARRHPDDIRLLIHVAADVWNFVDEHCGLVADAYRQTERRLTWHHENRLRLMTAALLDGTARIADLPDAAAALGLPERGRYAIMAVHGERPLSSYPAVVWHTAADVAYGIARLGEPEPQIDGTAGQIPVTTSVPLGHRPVPLPAGPAALATGLRIAPGTRIGISSAVSGLTAVGDARRLADTALQYLHVRGRLRAAGEPVAGRAGRLVTRAERRARRAGARPAAATRSGRP